MSADGPTWRTNYFWSLTDQTNTLALAFVSHVFLARVLGEQEYGRYNLILAMGGLILVVSDLGLNVSAQRFVARSRGLEQAHPRPPWTAAWQLRGWTGVLFACLLVLVYFLLPVIYPQHALQAYFLFFLLPLLLNFLYSFQRHLLLGHQRHKALCLFSGGMQLLFLVGLLALWVLEVEVRLPIIFGLRFLVDLPVNLMVLRFSFGLLTRMPQTASHDQEVAASRLQLRESMRSVAVVTISALIYNRIGILIAGRYVLDGQLSNLSISTQIVEAAMLPMVAFRLTLEPQISRMVQHGVAGSLTLRRLHRRTLLLGAIYGALMVVLIRLVAPFVVPVIWSKAYVGVVELLAVHVFYLVSLCIGMGGNPFLISSGYARISGYLTVVSAVVNIGLGLVLIPRFGVMGAIYTNLATHACQTLCAVSYFWKKTSPSA